MTDAPIPESVDPSPAVPDAVAEARPNPRPRPPLRGRKLSKQRPSVRGPKMPKPVTAWYRMEAMFDGHAREILKVGEEHVTLLGWVPPDNAVAVCLIPPSITHTQGQALQKILEANFRAPVLLLTDTIQLVKLKPISDGKARLLMAAAAGNVLQYERGVDGPT